MVINYRYFDSIDSTNNWIKSHLELIKKDSLLVISANRQTAGRGRLGRNWNSSDDSNIYSSCGFFIEDNKFLIGNIPQILALSVLDVLKLYGFSLRIKWPNDLFLDDKKIGGILTESVFENGLIIIVGIGINVNCTKEFLSAIDQPATSLFIEGGAVLDKDKILKQVFSLFKINLEALNNGGFSIFSDKYNDTLMKSKKIIKIVDGKNSFYGFIKKIDADGALIVNCNGIDKRVISGEIETL